MSVWVVLQAVRAVSNSSSIPRYRRASFPPSSGKPTAVAVCLRRHMGKTLYRCPAPLFRQKHAGIGAGVRRRLLRHTRTGVIPRYDGCGGAHGTDGNSSARRDDSGSSRSTRLKCSRSLRRRDDRYPLKTVLAAHGVAMFARTVAIFAGDVRGAGAAPFRTARAKRRDGDDRHPDAARSLRDLERLSWTAS